MKSKLVLISLTFVLFFLPNVNFGQNPVIPSLGAASSFVLYTGSGTIINAGVTTFGGNIGTNSGTISGFADQSNSLFHTQDALTASCASYLPQFFNTLKALPATISSHTAAFGAGEVLVPGVYSVPSAATMAGIVTLDGLNNSNSKFIIIIPGALALTAGTEIKLINGASASNVFWILDGALGVGAGSKLVGTFICESGTIGVGANCTINGHLLSISGAITVSTSVLTVTNSMVLGASQTVAPGAAPSNLIVTGNTSAIVKWQSSLTSNFNNPTDIVNTTTTLTGTSIGVVSLATYFRAVMNLDGANMESNAVKISISSPSIAPNLGPTASFVLFTSAGAVTGAGATTYTGNIGTNLGTLAGFTNMSDPLLHSQDALTAGCANYLPELFNTLKEIPSTATHAAAFTDGEVLNAGVYQFPIASTMAGTVTLDGAGNPNAVFIFKIPGALALTAATKIKLINGTTAANVFWVMDGAFAAGANCVLAGTFICEAGIVTIGNACGLNGHVFNISGAVTVTNSRLTVSNSMVLGASQTIAPGTLAANLMVTGNTNPIIKWQSSLTANFNIATDIVNTSTILTGSAIGVLGLSTYYRAVMIADGAETGSNAAKITITTPSIAPNLGPTASFVLFTSAGPVTGVGATTFTGNIGTNLGTITGFTNMSDPLLHIQDALTAGCANYLSELFSNLKAIPTTATHTAAFADGEVLNAGVYQIPIASTMAGTITLDGAGNPNAVFIFKIPGALALTAATSIKLINGATAANVFWIMDGAFAAGANSVLAGTFICESGIVGIGTNCSLNGHVFTISGAINVTNSKLTVTNAMVLGASQTIAPRTLAANLVVTGNTTPIIKWQSSLTADFNIPTDIANTTTTLKGTAIGVLGLSTYFRAVMTLDGADTGSNAAKITITTPTIAPNLGPAASFVLFTSAGTVTGAGAVAFTGNIGTNAGIIAGFSDLSNPLFHTQDALTASCASYLPEIVSTLKAIPTTATHAAAFVAGEVISSGVYQIISASTLAGVVTLDGGGNSNAVFVFKIPGALALTAASEMKLINGAAASNVFWVLDGALAAGASSKLTGTFICESGIIGIGAGCTINGHVFTMAGAVTVTSTNLSLTSAMTLSASQTIAFGALPADLEITGNSSPITKWQTSLTADFSNPTTISHYSTKLSGSCIGILDITTYFRAMQVLDGAETSSNYVKITIASTSIAPNLGPAGSFLLFTSAGAIANAGTSTFTGNIGTNAGVISGFPDMADTKLHTQDALTASCSGYVLEMFNNVKAIPTTNTSHVAGFVTGELLIPGVYQIDTASTVTGVITLDGGGNANSVFVFKINGALAIAASAEIRLLNGATASNVFWNINGAFSAGASAILKGTFICEYGIISLGANCSLDGHAYTNYGAVTLSNSTLTAVVVTNSLIVTANQNIVSGTIPASLNLTGNTAPVVRWEKATDYLFTNPIAIANTTTTLTGTQIGVLTATYYFRAVVVSGSTTNYSTIVALRIVQNTVAGTITSNQNILAGDFPSNITITGNNGPVTRWQKSATIDFALPIDISSNSSFLLGLEIGTLTETTYIRAVVENCISTVEYTNTVTITVHAGAINILVLTANQSIAYDTVPADLVLTGNESPVVRWESATNPTFANPTTLLHFSSIYMGNCIGKLKVTTYFRAVVNDGVADIYSNSIKITVAAPVVPASTVPMGSLSDFVVFTSLGGVNGVQIPGVDNQFTGFVGTNFGAIVNMSSNPNDPRLQIQNALTIQAKADLITLKATLTNYSINGAPHKTHAAAFGLGEVVPPGVYDLTAAVRVTGKLFFDGKGDPNAVFIFNIPAAFSTAASVQMKLINGAQSGNIFWNIGAASESGASARLIGTFISSIGGINLGAANFVDGRLFTQVGGIQLPYSTLNMPTNMPTVPVNRVITSSNQTIALGTQPANLTVTGQNTAIIRWEKSVSPLFTNPIRIANTTATLTGDQIGALSENTYFRVVVVNGFSTTSSTVVAINITEATIPGTLTKSQNVCPTCLPSNLVVSGNNGPITHWQKALNPAFTTFTAIVTSATTLTGAVIGTLNATTYFRAMVQYCTLEPITTNTVVLSVIPFSVTGLLSSSQTITNADLVLTSATGTIIRWESAPTADFSSGIVAIPNTANTLAVTATGVVGGILYYRVVLENPSGAVVYSNTTPVTITTIVTPIAGLLANNQTPLSTEVDLTLSNSNGSVIGWESATTSDFSSPITTIENKTTSLTVSAIGATSQTLYYRVLLQNPGSTVVYTNFSPVVLTTVVQPIPGVLSNDQTPTSLSVDLTLVGATGTILGWEKSITPDFSSDVTSIDNLTTTLTTPAVSLLPTEDFYYRVVLQNLGSEIVYTNLSHVRVTEIVTPTRGSISNDQIICTGTEPTDVFLTDSSGDIKNWQRSSTLAFDFPAVIANTSTNLPGSAIGTLTATTYFRAVLQNLGSILVYSTPVTVAMNTVLPVAGIVSANQGYCSPTVPQNLSILGSIGTVATWQSALTANFQFPTDLIVPSDTVTGSALGTVSVTTYYRSVVKNCSATVYSTPIVVTIASISTWNGSAWNNGIPSFASSVIIAGDLNATQSIESCAMTVNTGVHVVIGSGANVTLDGALMVDPTGSFTLNNNSNLLQPAGAANTGIITVKRESAPLYRYDSTLWSAPVVGQNLRNFSPGTLSNRFYFYDCANSYNGNYAMVFNNPNFPGPIESNFNFEIAKGYLIRAPNTFSSYVPAVAPATISAISGVKYAGEFVGTPNNGNITTSLDPVNYGFNLVGNPYPSAINLGSFFTANQNTIEGTIWLWRKIADLGTTIGYATMTNLGVVSVQPGVQDIISNQTIRLGQGFFVKVKPTAAPLPTVTFTNEMRTGDLSNAFYRSTATENHRIWLNLSSANGVEAQTLIGYMTGATNDFDYGIEGKGFGDNAINLTSIVNNTNYAIQGRALPFLTTDTVPLNFKTATTGTYTIALDHFDGIFLTNQAVYIQDHVTGAIHNLKDSPYSFASEIGIFDSRFEIVYDNSALTVTAPTSTANNVVVYKQNQNIVVHTGTDKITNVKIYDIRGRLLTQKASNPAYEVVLPVSGANEILLVKVTVENGVTTTKKIIF